LVAATDGTKQSSDEEKEANQFAAKMLIPPTALQKLVDRFRPWKNDRYYDPDLIADFAEKHGIASSIVAGQLIHIHNVEIKYVQKLRTRLIWGQDGKIAIKSAAQV